MVSPKVILGIDPGFACAGYALITVSGSSMQLLDIGVLKQSAEESIFVRIGKFYDFFDALSAKNSVTHISLEIPFLGKNAQNFLKLGYLRGVVSLLCYKRGYTLFEFAPREIKFSVTGYGHADKEQVSNALKMFFPPLKNIQALKMDATDALAASLCAGMRL